MDGVFYDHNHLKITDFTVEGPRASYNLNEVVSLEPRVPKVELAIELAVSTVLFIVSQNVSGALQIACFSVAALIGALFLFTCFNLRRIYVRTAGGVMPLGGWTDSIDRRGLASALVRAKASGRPAGVVR